MSDENETDNPYQPPTLSDDPLAKQDADGPKARLNPVHWLLPILGYACFPLVTLLFFLGPYNHNIGPYNSAEIWDLFLAFSCCLLITLPIYAGSIVWLIVLRISKGNHSVWFTLYQMVSIVPPILWLVLSFAWVGVGG